MIMLLTHRSEIREELNAFWQGKGHEICIPAHHQDAMAMMKNSHPELIVLDLYLSKASGLDVLKSLRQDGYRGKIIVLSGEAMLSVARHTHSLGVDRVVHVPAKLDGHFDLGELETALQSSLRNQREGESRIARRV
jgi:DNA-binding response OmpR family regulator